MKAFAICEMDVADGSDIIHGIYKSMEEAVDELVSLESNPKCEIPFYIKEGQFTISKSEQ